MSKKEIATVSCCCGKLCLFVSGYAVAIEATQCWDGELFYLSDGPIGEYGGHNWNGDMLEVVAEKINKEVNELNESEKSEE